MTDQTTSRKHDDFVSTPIGLLLEAGSSTGNVDEFSSPPIPSFYRGPDQQDAETQ